MAAMIVLTMMIAASVLIIVPDDARANSGGVDAYGYGWVDNNAPSPTVSYNWIEISGTGTNTGLQGDDTYVGPLAIGFSFSFYGTTYTTFYASSNGFLTFGSGTSDLSPDPIPSSSSPNNFIAAYWDDLYVADTTVGIVYFETLGVAPYRQLVVEYWTGRELGGSTTMTFEFILNETGDIWLQYTTMNGNTGSGAGVGIEDSAGSIGSQYSYYAASLTDGLAIRFSLENVQFESDQTRTGVAGGTVSYDLTVRNGMGTTDSFDLTSTSTLGWSVTFYDSTGTTLLTDTNGDPSGYPDTGTLASGVTLSIVAKVLIPVAYGSTPDVATLTATSFADNSYMDAVTLTTNAVVPFEPPWLDDFEWGVFGGNTTHNWTTTSLSYSGVNMMTSDSGSYSMYTRGGVVTVTSWYINMSGKPSMVVGVWIRIGGTFSEDPDSGEDLVVEYLNESFVWKELERFLGTGSPGTIYFRNYSVPTDGYHPVFQFRFRQLGGSGTSFDYWHIDDFNVKYNTPPVANFTVSPSTALIGAPVTVNASASNDSEDPTSALEVRWDWENNGTMTSWTTTKIAQHAFSAVGTHTIALQVRDLAGMISSTTRAVNIVEGPPVTTLVLNGTLGLQGWYKTEVELELRATDDSSGVKETRYKLDGGDWTVYVEPFTVVSQGTHTIQYYSIDEADNSETAKTGSFKIDSVAPTVAFVQKDNAKLVNTSVVINWTASDDTSGIERFELSVDGGMWQILSSTTTSRDLTGLELGEHYAVLRAVDKAGRATEERLDFKVVEERGSNILLWVLLLVGLIVAVILLLFFFLLMRGRKQRQQVAPPYMGTPPPPPAPPT